MTFRLRTFLMSALALGALMPAAAQEAPANEAASTNAMLTNWLMVDALDRKCRVLGLVDRMAMTREIGAYTRIWRNAQGASTPEVLLSNLTTLTETAGDRANGINCDEAINYIYQARREYFRSLLAQIVSAAGNDQWDSEPDAIKASWQAVVNEIGGFFGGEEFNRLREIFEADMADEEIDKTARWNQLRPILFAAHFQLSAAENGFTLYPSDDRGGQFNFVFTRIEDEEDLPYTISAPVEISVTGEDGEPHALLSSTGKSDDGQIVVFLQEYDASAPPETLTASMLIQEPAQAGRPAALRSFDADDMAENDCPTSFCFIFPEEATPPDDGAEGRSIQLTFTAPQE